MVELRDEVPIVEAEAIKAISHAQILMAYVTKAHGKYQRNLGRYLNNGKEAPPYLWGYRTDHIPSYGAIAYDPQSSTITSLNILKSAIDTINSKMSQAKVRPYFVPTHGVYETIKAARSAQDFFDTWFDRANIYKKFTDVFRDSCIYDKGILFVDEDQMCVDRVGPWQVGLDPAEWNYGGPCGLTQGVLARKEFPVRLFKRIYGERKELKLVNWDTTNDAHELMIYWDLPGNRKWYFYGSECFACRKISYEKLPFVWLYWSSPAKGYFSTSIIDECYTLQVYVDEIQRRIDSATSKAIFNMVLVPKGSDLKVSTFTNEPCIVKEFNPGPMNAAPIFVTPPAISDQYIQLLQLYIQQIYNIIGVSQLSAQSRKPAGANSGKALDTLADIESERFQVALSAYINCFIELADVCIEIFPDDASILPDTLTRISVKWKDIKKQRDLYTVQFAAATALSKDPTKRLQEVDTLVKNGYLPKELALRLMSIPDLADAYSITNAAYDYTQKVIERAAEKGELEYEPYTNLELLFTLTVQMLLRLSADDGNKREIENLRKLLKKVDDELKQVEAPTPGSTMAPQAAPPQVNTAPPAAMGGAPLGA